MHNIRRIASIAVAVLVAAISGFQMQRGPGSAPSLAAAPAAPPSVAAPVETAALPVLPGLPLRTAPAEVATLPAALACTAPRLTLAPAAGAMLALDLTAPCLPAARVELRLGALTFAVQTDAEGRYQGMAPAMTRSTIVQALLPDGTELTAGAEVEGLASFGRVALIAGASAALHLSAAPGGEIIALGDPAARPALLAEVHSIAASAPEAEVTLVADLTPATCGADLRAAFWRAGEPAPVPVTLAMPECDGIDGAVLLPLPAAPLALAAAD